MRRADAARGLPARDARPHRHPRGLRARHLRRLHDPVQWRGGALVHHAGRAGGRRRAHHGGGAREGRRPAPAAGGLPRVPRPAMRLLHAGHAHHRARLAAHLPASDGRGDPRRHLRGAVPLHRLPGHHERRARRERPSARERPRLMLVVDFHIHAYDYPVNAPPSFVQFMDREMAKTYGSYTKFVEQYTTGESYLRVLDEAGVDYGVILAELAPITSAIASNETVDRLCDGHPRLIP